MGNTKERFKCEYKTIFAKNELKNIYIDKYPYFGWRLCDTNGKTFLRFKRNKHISNIREIKSLQKEFDGAVSKIKRCQRMQAIVSGVTTAIFWILIVSYIIWLIINRNKFEVANKILLWSIAGIAIFGQHHLQHAVGNAVSRFTKATMADRLDEIDEICAKVKKIDINKDHTIYVLLTKSTTRISKMIRMATKDSYTHVSLSFRKDLKTLYSFSRKWHPIPLPAGLRLESLERYHNKSDEAMCALYELAVDEDTYNSVKREVEQMMVQAQTYKFNAVGLILCKFGIPVRRKHNYFCSQFLGEVLIKNNAITLPKEPSLMRPVDYTFLPELSCIFEGKLSTLTKKCS